MTRTAPIPTPHGDVVLIEYDTDDAVISVAVRRDTRHGTRFDCWRFETSARDDVTYAAEDGGGPEPLNLSAYSRATSESIAVRVWHVDGLSLQRFSHHVDLGQRGSGCVYVSVATAADYAACGMVRILAPIALDPFDGIEIVDGFELDYCDICGPMRDDNHCGHISDGDDGLCGPGASDSFDRGVPDGFVRVVRLLGCARALRRQIRAGARAKRLISMPLIGRNYIDMRIAGVNFSGAVNALCDLDDDAGLHEGITWVLGLDAATTAANAVALAWLDAEIATQDARRLSGERCYGVVGQRRNGNKTIVRGVSWTEALAALRALPAAQRQRDDGDRARIVRVAKDGVS